MSASAARIFVVIPALNEALTLRALVRQVLERYPDVIVVDDGSTDGSAETVSDLPILLLRHAQRRGKGNALRDGLGLALAHGADAVATMDADGQHAVTDLPRLVAAWRADPRRIVIGARLRGRERQPVARRRANAVADWFVSWAAGQPIVDSQSGQRIYPRAALELARGIDSDGFEFEADVLIGAARRGIEWVAVPIDARYAPGLRASHFAPVTDIARITRRVASHIVRGGFLVPHLWRLRGQRVRLVDPAGPTDPR